MTSVVNFMSFWPETLKNLLPETGCAVH